MNEPFKKHARRSQELQNRNKKKRNILDTLACVKAIVRKQATTGLEEMEGKLCDETGGDEIFSHYKA